MKKSTREDAVEFKGEVTSPKKALSDQKLSSFSLEAISIWGQELSFFGRLNRVKTGCNS